ncbi:glycosyltransferase family 9 protein [bacterium]|nr:glycosyltransferase family 9 protein [bacterium]
MKNILVINFGGIGDEILFLPTLISLKKEFPNSKITLALESRSRAICDLTDIIDNTVFVDIKTKNKYIELLKLIFKSWFGRYDFVVSSGASPFISIVLFLTGIKRRYGYNTGKLSQKLLSEAVSLNKNQYASAMYHDLINPITSHKTYLPEISIPRSEKEPNTVLIHPGVSKMSVQKGCIKTVSPKIWAETINILIDNGKKVILTGGKDDEECINEIKTQIKHSENFIDYFNKTKTLKELAQLIAKCETFLCSDSCPLHVGVGVGAKTYVIFGPTNYKTLIPESENIIPVLANDDCPLKPCLWERRMTSCKELSCLNISASDIANKVLGR